MNQEVLHILLVGFHHKKGGQVEFSYPPLVPGTPGNNECPESWKYLPTLTLPDLSHNFNEDTVFFTLPSLIVSNETVYGCSCYRQISTEELKFKSEDFTRSSVQKAVCVLLHKPLYGYYEVKLTLIAQTFFEQGDFSNVDILIKAYQQLNACTPESPLNENGSYLSANSISHLHVGLGLRELMIKWRHKILLLFKLLVLEKKVIFFGSPVRPFCSLIMAINSLHPQLLEAGFREVAYVKPSRPLSPIPQFPSPIIEKKIFNSNEEIIEDSPKTEEDAEIKNREESNEDDEMVSNEKLQINRESSIDSLESNLLSFCSIKPNEWLAPLPIFKNGFLCLPFVSLNYLDLILDPSINGYVIGASNILFQQKMQLADVMIDVQALTIETNNTELRQQLRLTTEDLRFVDYIMKNVQNPKENGEGGENWIREQFGGYFVAMLRTIYETNTTKCSEAECFNRLFFDAWKKTNNFQEWLTRKITASAKTPNQTFNFDQMRPAHPFSTGAMTVADMKLKIAQSIHNTESGRKINLAVNKLSNWFSSFSNGATSHEERPKDKCSPENDTAIDEIASEIKEGTERDS